MQIGRLEMIDQAQVDYVSKISKIQETDKKTKIDPEEQYKNAQSAVTEDKKEVILDNVKFGFDEETKEFFIRIKSGDSEYQYPTEDMMKLKKSLMETFKIDKYS
jgi:uncharacterized protein (UPF0335 family)